MNDARNPVPLALRALGLFVLLAPPLVAQSRLVGWGPTRFDTTWMDDVYVEVEVGPEATVARRADGNIAAWGRGAGPLGVVPALPPGTSIQDIAVTTNQVGALLDDGTVLTWPSATVHSYAAPIAQLAAGGSHFVVLLGDGSLRAWGANDFGQIGYPPGSDFVEVAAGMHFSLARRTNGTVEAWGFNTGVQSPPPGLSFTQISAGHYHASAVLDDGTATSWGWTTDTFGQLSAPPPPPGLTFTKVDAGPWHTLGLLSDGSLVAWGANGSGQLDVPPLPPGMTYVDVSASGWNGTQADWRSVSVALRSDGRAVPFGWGGHGHLGAPALPPGLEFAEVSTSGHQPDLGGPITYPHSAARLSDGSVVVFGDHAYGQDEVPALPPGVTYVQVEAGGLHTVALRSDGRVRAWGLDWIANGFPAGASYVQVSAGQHHSLALASDGSIVGWGQAPASILNAPAPPPGVTYVAADAGNSHSIALRSDGQVAAWGSNTNGQLDAPPLPPGLAYVEIAAGGHHSLARRSDGVVVGWGWDFYGQASGVPAPPSGVVYVQIAAAGAYSVALRSDGGINAWGFSSGGQQFVPPLPPGHQYLEVAAGEGGIVARAGPVWSTYGTGKTNSLGCVPTIAVQGAPSASQSNGFNVACTEVQNQFFGMLIYTVNGNAASTPFQCGTLYVGPSGILRTPVRNSGGNPTPPADCSGLLVLDMNAFAAGAAGGVPHPALQQPGTVVHAQWWGRDNGFAPPCNTMLSDAIQYVVLP